MPGTAAEIAAALQTIVENQVPNVLVVQENVLPENLEAGKPGCILIQIDYNEQPLDWLQAEFQYIFGITLVIETQDRALVTQYLEGVRDELEADSTLGQVALDSSVQSLIPFTQDEQKHTVGEMIVRANWVA